MSAPYFRTGREGSSGLLPVSAVRSAVTHSKRRANDTRTRSLTHALTRTPRGKMSNFNNIFGAYTMTQLNEILEDDDKLTKMVYEMDEVG